MRIVPSPSPSPSPSASVFSSPGMISCAPGRPRRCVAPPRDFPRARRLPARSPPTRARVSASSAVDGPRPSDQSFSFPRSHPDESAPWVPTRCRPPRRRPRARESTRPAFANRPRRTPTTRASRAAPPRRSHPPSFHRGARTTTRASARECAAKMTRFRARPPVVRTGARTKGPSEGAEGAKGASEGASGSGASRLCSSSTLDIAEASARRMSFPGTTAAEQEIQRPAAREVAPEGKRPRRHVSVPERRTRGSRPGGTNEAPRSGRGVPRRDARGRRASRGARPNSAGGSAAPRCRRRRWRVRRSRCPRGGRSGWSRERPSAGRRA